MSKNILNIFFSNVDKNVFVLKNMPEVLKGALFSRYSRSSLPLRELFLKEYLNSEEFENIKKSTKELKNLSKIENILNTNKAKSFYSKWLAMFGDDSIAELAGIHLGIENISVLSTKVIEDSRVGMSPLEKSTRYVRFDDLENGRYKYYRDLDIMKSEYAKIYIRTLNLMFDTYSDLIDPMIKHFKKKYPKPEDVSDTAYETSVRAKALDTLRGLLPLATKTNMGIHANGRAVEYLITKMYAHPTKEVRDYALLIHKESKKFIENFVERVESKEGKAYIKYLRNTQKGSLDIANKIFKDTSSHINHINRSVKLLEYDECGDAKVAASILYQNTHEIYEDILSKTLAMKKSDLKKIFDTYTKQRGGRWHKVGKGFEDIYYTFEIVADFGAYKDLQRHRMNTLQRQFFTTELGYEIPKDIVEAKVDERYKRAMDASDKAYRRIKGKFPYQSQYVVGHGHFIRWKMKMNLREAFHICELRSSPQGHPSYRQIAQEMYKLIKEVNPLVGNSIKFVNMSDPGLERLAAEVRKEERLGAISKKEKKAKDK